MLIENDLDHFYQRIKNYLSQKKKKEIDIWIIRKKRKFIIDNKKDFFLNKEEKNRLPKMNPKRKEQFLFSRFFIKILIQQYLFTFFSKKEISLNKIDFNYNKYGKPYYEGTKQKLNFNFSHSNDYFVFAFSQKPIGVDIQNYQSSLDFKKILMRYFNENQKCKNENEFFTLWSSREAIVKCLGKSFFSVGKIILSPLLEKWHFLKNKEIFYQNFLFQKNNYLSVAVQSKEKLKINFISLDEFYYSSYSNRN